MALLTWMLDTESSTLLLGTRLFTTQDGPPIGNVSVIDIYRTAALILQIITVNRIGPHNPPSSSDDDDPPSWMSGHPDPPSFSSRHPDPPSWSSQSTDPPSWLSRSADPPAWSMRRGVPPQSTFSTESQNWMEPRPRLGVESASWASPQQTGTSPTVSSLVPTSISSYVPLSSIHRRKLPTSNMTLDSALTDVDLKISPWRTPSEYIDAEANYVNNIVHEIQGLTQGRVEIKHPSFGRTMIYSVSRERRNPLARKII